MIGGSSPGRGWQFFSTPPCPNWLWNPSRLLSNGYQGLFPWLEADHSPPSSAELKNEWSYISTPQYAFMALCSVKAQAEILPFTFFLSRTELEIIGQFSHSTKPLQTDKEQKTSCIFGEILSLLHRRGRKAVALPQITAVKSKWGTYHVKEHERCIKIPSLC
jgi:hypothetical protein